MKSITVLRSKVSRDPKAYDWLLATLPRQCVTVHSKSCTVDLTLQTARILWDYFKRQGSDKQRYLIGAWLVLQGEPCEDRSQLLVPITVRMRPPVSHQEVQLFEQVVADAGAAVRTVSATACYFTVDNTDLALMLWRACRRIGSRETTERLHIYLMAHRQDPYAQVTRESYVAELDLSPQARFACERKGMTQVGDVIHGLHELSYDARREVEATLKSYPHLNPEE